MHRCHGGVGDAAAGSPPPCRGGAGAGSGPSSSPSRSGAGSTTNPAVAQLLHFRFVSLAGICPNGFSMPRCLSGEPPRAPPSSWVGEARGLPPSRSSETPRKPHKPLRGDMWWRQNHHPMGSSETKRDLYRHNKDIKAKERERKKKKTDSTQGRRGDAQRQSPPCTTNELKKRNQRR